MVPVFDFKLKFYILVVCIQSLFGNYYRNFVHKLILYDRKKNFRYKDLKYKTTAKVSGPI